MFEVKGSHLSSVKRSGRTSLHLSGLDWLQSLKQKPKTQYHFENGHRRIEQPIVNDFVEGREDEKNEGANDAPDRRDHTEESQSLRDVVRLEPQVGANGRG